MAPRSRRDDPASVFVDTSGWIAFFSARDAHHAEADLLFRRAIERRIPLLTTNLVIAELQRLLLHRAGIRAAATALDRIDLSPGVKVHFADERVHRGARAWLRRLGDQVLTYTDAASFTVMAARRCTVALSFDSDFVTAGYTLWRSWPRP